MKQQNSLLKPEERHELLLSARRTLEEQLHYGRALVIEEVSDNLLEPRGAFVTLHKNGSLRGCIGTFEATDPLISTVQRMAIAAATKDPRFPPVEAEELSSLDLEISVLSPLSKASPEEVQVGVHGIYITRGFYRGVLLPQVAVEYGWDSQTFLKQTCLKAGLPPLAWQDPETQIEIFTAEVFGEENHDLQ